MTGLPSIKISTSARLAAVALKARVAGQCTEKNKYSVGGDCYFAGATLKREKKCLQQAFLNRFGTPLEELLCLIRRSIMVEVE